MDLDLLVLGSGPSGQRAAVQGAKLGKRVAVVERLERVGGVSIHSGTIPSKTLREAVFEQLRRNNVGMLYGFASFSGPHSVTVQGEDGAKACTAERIVIAVGTVPARPTDVSFDDLTVIDSDGILRLERRPRTMTVVGAGVIGAEYASMMAALGVKVTLVDGRADLLPFLDREIAEALQFLLRRRGVTFRREEEVTGGRASRGGCGDRAALGQAHPYRDRPLRRGTPGRDRGPRARARGARGGRPWADRGRRGLPHVCSAHLRRGRRGRTSRPRRDRLRAGADRDPARVRPAGDAAAEPRADGRLRDPGDRHGRQHRGAADRAGGALPGRPCALERARPRPDDGRRGRHPEAAGRARGRHAARGPRARNDGRRPRPHRSGADGTPRRTRFLLAAVFNYPTFAESYKVAALDAQNRIRLGG